MGGCGYNRGEVLRWWWRFWCSRGRVGRVGLGGWGRDVTDPAGTAGATWETAGGEWACGVGWGVVEMTTYGETVAD